MFVTGSVGSFVAFDNCGSGGLEGLASEVAVHFVAVCLEHSAEIVFDGHHPSLPLHFCKWGNSVPIHISLSLVLQQHWGLLTLGPVVLS